MTYFWHFRPLWVGPIVFFYFLLATADGMAQRSDFWGVDFSKADSIATLYENHDLKHPEELAVALTKDLSTPVEKFRAIFYWITQNIAYDYRMFQDHAAQEAKLARKQKQLHAWRRKFHKRMYSVLLNQKRSICSGYAMLLETMSQSVGINCKKISGMGRGWDDQIGRWADNHAWNVVQFGHKWYVCDATWASGYYDDDFKKYRKDFNDDYFLTDPSLFVATHFPADTTWVLQAQNPTRQQFLDAPIKTSGFINYQINAYAPVKGIVRTKKGSAVTFAFTSNYPSDKITRVGALIQGVKKSVTLDGVFTKDREGGYTMTHVFEEKGRFLVGFFINRKYILQYEVYVK